MGVCVVMHFLHGKCCVTDTTASLVIQDGGLRGAHVCDKIYVKPLLWTQFGIRCHRLRDKQVKTLSFTGR